MDVFDRIGADDYEQVVFCHDRGTGLRAIVAVHSTRLGPALGGTRFYPYPSEADGLEDVLRLARGMTYKAAAAGLDLGGGKAVIFGDPRRDKSEALLRAYARHVEALGGRYLTAEDVGTTQADMDIVRRETRFVTGVSRELGGSGDPSDATAYGVLWAMKAVAQRLWGDTSLVGRHVAVAGVGKVGRALVGHLAEERARVTVADVTPVAVEWAVTEVGAEVVAVEKIHAVECDIYSPCALGGVLNTSTIPELRCAAVLGSANNQLADGAASARLLADAGVLYAPDFVVNAGGLINIAEELAPGGYHPDLARAAVRRIFDTLTSVLSAAEQDGVTTAEAADRRAQDRIAALSAVHQIRIPS
ncbi:MAG: Branched-chain amino acid dehydrogenase [deaminating](EC [uncultured Acidimicrobiales bacterium]|uniref:Branched-chain amino acid dehydrogenase [deaminating](EC) n=1 Tax=uncultured Acidimicrobiales bacterium TaxID=310071 RepID=A0A6J4IFX8_9ACTN|nr:MAG: Branched-chain amino acid dehydrogenase [deaminating](EC [uncultured Acidimicrobiales bacterium]